MSMVRGWIVATVLLCVTGAPVIAQTSTHRDGFWISFGLGGGANLDSDIENRGGGGVYVRLGGTPSNQVLLGGEITAMVRDAGTLNGTLTQGNATFSALFYPSKSGNFFLKGGVGFATVEATGTVGAFSVSANRQGFGSTIGLGGDIRVGRKISIVPNLDLLLQAFEEGGNSVLLATLGIVFH